MEKFVSATTSDRTGVAVPDARADSPPPVACLYCGGADYEIGLKGLRDRLAMTTATWSWWRCRGCGSAVISPFPKPEDLAAYYPAVYSFAPELGRVGPVRRILAALEYRFFFRPQYASVARCVLRNATGLPPRPRLLDVGCGRGIRMLSFRERGCDVEGMDFQPELAEYARSQLGIQVTCTPVEELTRHFAPASFDILTAIYVVEHVTDVKSLLASCYALLKPGGWLVAGVPLFDSVQAGVLGTRWLNAADIRHVALPSQEGMRRSCRSVGFSEIKFRPDPLTICSGLYALSIMPGATTTAVYTLGGAITLCKRLLAGALTTFFLPWVAVENYLLHRPGQALVFARKPIGAA
jgi:SAM-dependent methyltransferase